MFAANLDMSDDSEEEDARALERAWRRRGRADGKRSAAEEASALDDEAREEAAYLLQALASQENQSKAAIGDRVAASVTGMVQKVHAGVYAAVRTPGQSTGQQTPAVSEHGSAEKDELAELSERLAVAQAEAEASAGPAGLVRVREIEWEMAELRAKAAQAMLEALREEEAARRRNRAAFAARAVAAAAEKEAAAVRRAADEHRRRRDTEEERRRAEEEQLEALQLAAKTLASQPDATLIRLEQAEKARKEAEQAAVQARAEEEARLCAQRAADEVLLIRHGQLAERKSRLDEIQASLDEVKQQRELILIERQAQAQAQEAEALRLASEEAAARIRLKQAEKARKEAEQAAAQARTEEEARLLAQRAVDEERTRLLAAQEEERAKEAHEEVMAVARQQEAEMREAREAVLAEAEAEEAALQQMVAQMREETGNPLMSEEECAEAMVRVRQCIFSCLLCVHPRLHARTS